MDVSDIMTNRTQIDWIDLEDTEETIVKEMLTFNHLLIPVCRCSLDDLLGLASVTDIFGNITMPYRTVIARLLLLS